MPDTILIARMDKAESGIRHETQTAEHAVTLRWLGYRPPKIRHPGKDGKNCTPVLNRNEHAPQEDRPSGTEV